MGKTLEELRKILLEGQRRSMSGSYMRRNPTKEALPFLVEARVGLREYVRQHEAEIEAWRLLSQAEECLLDYTAAQTCLERAMTLAGRRDKKDLKRLASLKEYQSEWSELTLTPAQLEELSIYLRGRLLEDACDHTFRFTREWLQQANVDHPNDVIEALRNRGGSCDCEVLNNVGLG